MQIVQSQSQQTHGTDFPKRRVVPIARSGYRSLSTDHGLRNNRTSGTTLEHMHDTTDNPATTRFLPRTSVGKCSSNHSHCSSLSQNRFLLMDRNPSLNRTNIALPE